MLDHYVKKMRVTKLIKTINKKRRLHIVGMTKIPIIYLINMRSKKIVMIVKPVSLTIKTIHTMTKVGSYNMQRNPSQRNHIL